MFLSLRRPYSCYGGPTGYCRGQRSSQPTMDVDLPLIMNQLEELSKQIFGDREVGEPSSPSKPTNFNLKLAMRSFRPEDVKVNVDGDNVIVEARREEKEEKEGSYSYNLREVKRTYPIPEGVDKKKLSSAFTRNGVLEIEAPLLPVKEETTPDKTDVEVVHVNEK